MSSATKIMGIDFGSKRTGIALSDPLGVTASPYSVLEEKDRYKLLERIALLVREKKVQLIVVGLPLNMDGSRGRAVDKVMWLVRRLRRRVEVPVLTYDERLSSYSASKWVQGRQIAGDEALDHVAAAVILQDYLDSNS